MRHEYDLNWIDTAVLNERLTELLAKETLSDVDVEEARELQKLRNTVSKYSDDSFEDGITIVRDDHFVDYIQDLVEECGDIPRGLLPRYLRIDWQATAEELRPDFTSVEFFGRTFWYR
jgi:hypothetical protein